MSSAELSVHFHLYQHFGFMAQNCHSGIMLLCKHIASPSRCNSMLEVFVTRVCGGDRHRCCNFACVMLTLCDCVSFYSVLLKYWVCHRVSIVCMCMLCMLRTCLYVMMHVRGVFVWDEETERDRKTNRETENEREREYVWNATATLEPACVIICKRFEDFAVWVHIHSHCIPPFKIIHPLIQFRVFDARMSAKSSPQLLS